MSGLTNNLSGSASIIIAAERSVDQQGDLSATQALIQQAESEGQRCITLTIDDLNTPWQSPIQKHHFRSGCGPIEALSVANRLIQEDECDLAVIHGKDFLRSEQSQNDRHTKMAIYPEMAIPEAYTQLARHFYQHHGFTEAEFLQLRDAVFDNLKHTAEQLGLKLPAENWYQPITSLYRGVDCANPVTDFEGQIVVTSQDSSLPRLINPIEIKGVGIGIADKDGPEHARELAQYHALEKACHYAEVQSNCDIAEVINSPTALLDAYTCYPVVPIALLMKGGGLQSVQSILDLLKTKALTTTGGMNLARAPWNNPALQGLIAMCQKLQENQGLGLVHGNGGLGYRQGIALLSN